MTEWYLVDFMSPLGDDEGEAPRTEIRTEAQLRAELTRFRGRRPAMVALIGPEGERLDIGIGGPWAGVQWTKPPYSTHLKMAVATGARAPSGVDFACEGSSGGFRPEHLLPAEQAIEIAAHFFARRGLPEWVGWATWSPETGRAEPAPANGAPPAVQPLDAGAPVAPPVRPS